MAACLLMVSTTAMAVPAKRVKKTITLANGTQKEVMLVGDENMHYYLDAEENAYTRNADGIYVKKDREQLQSLWKERLAARNKHRMERALARGMNLTPEMARENKVRRKAEWGAEKNPISGDKKGLVILVNFADMELNAAHRNEYYNRFFNEEGFSESGNAGSVHDYFYECSYGQFNLTFDVYGPVTVSKECAYYGQNNENGDDMYAAEMVAEACRLADELGADFSQYDWDGDGIVDQVFLVYAGYGEHAGADESTIWPHEYSLADAGNYGDGTGAITLDGTMVDTYAVSSELDGNKGNTPAGIGTACHEFSHCMCIPDFYDTSNHGYYGMDSWDLMDYGSYSGNYRGNCPVPYTSYERMYCGWLTPVELSAPTQISGMQSLYESPEAYIIYNEKNRKEYYMLENRQNLGFGASNPAHGMLVLHVYFDSNVWAENTVNSSTTQRMTIIPADGKLSVFTNSGDTWPGTTHNTALTDTSSPAATLYVANTDGRKLMGKPIEEIEESADGKISFAFNGGLPIGIPVATEATDISGNAFTANWTPVEGATGYIVQLTATDLLMKEYDLKEVTLLEEDFSGFNNGKTSAGTSDIGEHLDEYTETPGWKGYKLYTTPENAVKVGSAKSEGYIFTPWLKSTTGVVTMSFTVRRYGTDKEPVILYTGTGGSLTPIDEIDLTSNPVRHLVTTTVENEDWYWGLYCGSRCYISEMCAYEGKVTEEQIESGKVTEVKSETSEVTTEGNSYQFTNLSDQCKYSYCVRAVSDAGQSKWSNNIEVELMNETAIDGPTPNPSRNGGEIYDLAGRKVQGARSKGQEDSSMFNVQCSMFNGLRKGIYIVNGRKVVK